MSSPPTIQGVLDKVDPAIFVKSMGYTLPTARNRVNWLRMMGVWIDKPVALASREDVLMIVGRLGRDYRNRSPDTLGRCLRRYFDWIHSVFPWYESPIAGVKVPLGSPEPERPVLTAEQIEKILAYVELHEKREFYWVCLLAGRHLMREWELLPYRMDKPKRICSCEGPGDCNKKDQDGDWLHHFKILPGGRVKFRVKGARGAGRWAKPEPFSSDELHMLEVIIAKPPIIASTFGKKLRKIAGRLKIELRNDADERFALGAHIFARHSVLTIMGRTAPPQALARAAHVVGSPQWFRRYVHPSEADVEDAKEQTINALFRREQ